MIINRMTREAAETAVKTARHGSVTVTRQGSGVRFLGKRIGTINDDWRRVNWTSADAYFDLDFDQAVRLHAEFGAVLHELLNTKKQEAERLTMQVEEAIATVDTMAGFTV